MSFPDRKTRQVCWDSRDRYWECLDDENVKDSSEIPKKCSQLRRVFENSCPTQWVMHFDRKRDFDVFKQKMQKEGFEPIKEKAMGGDKEFNKITLKLDIETKNLSLDTIQEILIYTKRCQKNMQKFSTPMTDWNRLADLLWSHLQNGLNKMDDQLLCATCFYTVLMNTDKQEFYLTKITKMIDDEIIERHDLNSQPSSSQVTSLMYGIFQSSFLIDVSVGINDISHILNSTIHLLILLAYEYSQFTFIAFKTLSSINKVQGLAFESAVFSDDNWIKLLNLVNHNWENPITGVKDLNRRIFQILIQVIDEDKYQSVVQDINQFYWNKAKYLMLSEVIEYYSGDVTSYMIENDWTSGLINSLFKPGLVSAGTDMYYSILKKINSVEEWSRLFLLQILKLLVGSSNKAIENFNNYWCLITLKKFPSLLIIMIDQLKKIDDSESSLYSMLFILKQGHKLGIPKANEIITASERTRALEHNHTHIRMLAFDIVCISNFKGIPNKADYDHVLCYIKYNINSDCTVLRINMLNSLNIFLSQLHVSFRNRQDNSKEHLFEMIDFFKSLQGLVIESFNCNGNYQRKITSVKIIKTVLECVTEVPKKKKEQIKSNSVSLIEYLKDNECWFLNDSMFVSNLMEKLMDPSDDIRDNIYKLLLNHYSDAIKNTTSMNNLIRKALKSIKSKFFYDISCGQTMFKLIVNILIKEQHVEADFQTVEDVFKFAHEELLSEFALKHDVLKSIENGRQLHSLINILVVVLEVCISNSFKIHIPDKRDIHLLDVLKGAENQFSCNQHNLASNDFAQINEMVESIIAQSENDAVNENDKTKISGLHQIVLNCLWLNVKAACDLSSVLTQYYKEDFDKCGISLTVITNVLETSRHKGAIEAAGSALGRSIQFLTSLPDSSPVANLPQTLLKAKLDMLIAEASKLASITRRGAGLSIMVHRIVSSDMRKGKPLFHYFMKTLLNTCAFTEDIPVVPDKTNIENEMDLPKAIFIHFLTRIVTDSSLASDLMFYSAELAELAFSNLASPHWQIRNAALQLYGALIPRLIGQKKASGSDEETIATVACDELRTHSPKLWTFILEQLRCVSESEKICSHSNLVPILNLLASCAIRYKFSYDDQKDQNSDILKSLLKILDSPILTVRRLTAKCIFNISSIKDLEPALMNDNYSSENFLHGALLLFNYYEKNKPRESCKYEHNLKEKFTNIFETKNCSYISKDIFNSIYRENISDVKVVLHKLNEGNHSPGIYLWANNCIKHNIMNLEWTDLSHTLLVLMEHKDLEESLDYFLNMLKCKEAAPNPVLTEAMQILLSFKNKFENSSIWKLLYNISLQVENRNIDVTDILTHLTEFGACYKLRYAVPFAARMIGNVKERNLLQLLVNIINKLSNFEHNDVDMRYISAIANNELAYHFDQFSDNAKLITLKTAIILLHDEDEDVRNASVHFCKQMRKSHMLVHANICISKILDKDFLIDLFDNPKRYIQILCKDLIQFLSQNAHCVDQYNPFANESKNIYLEADILHTKLETLLQSLE